jgi:TatD DNase family protein
MIDTHCHLDAQEFDPDRAQVMREASSMGVRCVVVPAVEQGNFARVRELSSASWGEGGPCLVYALGIHPIYVDTAGADDLCLLERELEARLGDERLVAVGEIGLDHFVPGLDHRRQEQFFIRQLEFARALGLPVILHVRHAQDRVLKYLRKIRVVGGIAHAFNGSLQQAHAFLDLGFVLGFGGAMTFERALRIRALVRQLPAQAHVLETDAPDIAPAWCHPGRNSPAQLARIAAVFAELRGESVATALMQTGANACRALPRLARHLGSRPTG